MSEKLKEYKGVIHIHTKFSDGSAEWEDVVHSAQVVGLDYVIITDHNTLVLKEKEGWYRNTLLLVGEEISPKRSHYLALGIKRAIYPDEEDPREYIKKVNREGGIGFIVHPFYHGKRHLRLKDSSWQNLLEIDDFTGIELWSWMYDWIEPVNLFNLLFYWLFPHRSITGPPIELLKLWDSLTAKRRVSAIAGLDAHGKKIFPGIILFPYTELFKTLRTHVLTLPFTGDTTNDAEKLYGAIRNGNSWLANDYLANSEGFSFSTSTGEIVGDEVKLVKDLTLIVKSPHLCSLRIIHKGNLVYQKEGKEVSLKVRGTGPYRVEAYLDKNPWVFTNPIYITE